MKLKLAFEIRMAWREIRSAYRKFLFLVVAIALGVGALTGLKGVSRSLDRSIARSARNLVAADLAVRFSTPATQKDIDSLGALTLRGAELSRTTETLSMVSPAKANLPILSEVRAVDPQTYPFYGTVELEPAIPLNKILGTDDAVVTRDFLVRTGSLPGDRIQIGSTFFRIAAVLKSEPDRIAFGVNLGPRVLITRKGLERSGLIQFGSRASESFLIRLPGNGLSLDEARKIVQTSISRRTRIVDYRNPNPSVSRGLERATAFFSLIGLLAVLLAGLGVSTTIQAFLRQKLDSIAIIKCVGGRSIQIIRIYLVQGLIIGISGSAVGIGLGYAVQLLFPVLIRGLISLPTNLELAPGAAVQGLCVGVLTTMLFMLPPLLSIRSVSPVRIFLRDTPEIRSSIFKRLRRDPLPILVFIILLTGTGLIAGWVAESLRWGFVFLAGLAGCVLILGLAAKILLIAVRRMPRLSSLVLRQGLKNLHRPGNQAVPVIISLGLGVAFVLTVYFIQTSLLSQIVRSAPADFPNVFLLGITEDQEPSLTRFLNQQGGLQSHALIPAVSSRLLTVNGKTADQLEISDHERRHMRNDFTLTWSDSIPPDTRVVEGTWWKPPFNAGLVSVGEDAARQFKLRIGSVLEFDASGKTIRGTVVNIRNIEFSRPGISNQFIFSPGSLSGYPVSYIATMRMQPSRVADFQSAVFKYYPGVTAIDVGQVLVRIQELLDKISTLIQFVAIFAIIAGIVILASSVASTRYQRIKESALLKTLGATRRQVLSIQAAEFLMTGSLAGIIGGALAAMTAYLLLGRLLDTEFDFRWIPLAVGLAVTALLAMGTGWLTSRGVLNQKPLEVLREN